MSPVPRRALTVDDPVGGREACHVARPPAPVKTESRLRQIPIEDIHPMDFSAPPPPMPVRQL